MRLPFTISSLPLGAGHIGICPMPGRGGAYAQDLAALLHWAPKLVVTMTPSAELVAGGAASLPEDLARQGISWAHLPVTDFDVPGAETAALWPETRARVRAVLDRGARVLVHCMGGCGRSGMAILRLMVESGEDPPAALVRLRAVRPCAVETEPQHRWATGP
jgi:protein-tyrosine phosphatase